MPGSPAFVRDGRPGVQTRLVQVFIIALFVFPSNAVVAVMGAAGHVAGIVGLGCLALWVAYVALGLHDPFQRANPVRLGLLLLTLATLLSYALAARYRMPEALSLAADRQLLQLVMVAGVILLISEGSGSFANMLRIAQTAVWAATFSIAVAALQFFAGFDLSTILSSAPGLELNWIWPKLVVRGEFLRVAGTAIHPIEFGVVSSTMLPIALWYGLARGRLLSWVPPAALLLGTALSISRSAILSAVAGLLVLALTLPPRRRLATLGVAIMGGLLVFAAVPGLWGTIADYATAGTADASIASRVDDYPLVENLVAEAPLLGSGPASFVFQNDLEILDNQYLGSAVTTGLVGLAALIAFMVLPVVAALHSRSRLAERDYSALAAAVAAAGVAATIALATFDAFSFPQFVGTHAIVAGLAGALFSLAMRPTSQSLFTSSSDAEISGGHVGN